MDFSKAFQFFIDNEGMAEISKLDKIYYDDFKKIIDILRLQYCGELSKSEIEPEIYSFNKMFFSFNKEKLIEFATKYIKIKFVGEHMKEEKLKIIVKV